MILLLTITYNLVSRPVWGAWIEIERLRDLPGMPAGRAPYGARGLKCFIEYSGNITIDVAPRMGRVD